MLKGLPNSNILLWANISTNLLIAISCFLIISQHNLVVAQKYKPCWFASLTSLNFYHLLQFPFFSSQIGAAEFCTMPPISLQLTPFISPLLHRPNLCLHRPPIPRLSPPRSLTIRSVQQNNEHPSPSPPPKPTGLDDFLSTAASLYPLYVTAGGIVACVEPSTFSWFVQRGPSSYSLSLGLIMLAMGLTLEIKDLFNLFMQRPLSVSFWNLNLFRLCWIGFGVWGILIIDLMGWNWGFVVIFVMLDGFDSVALF